MCYDVQAKLKSQLKRAKANNDHTSIVELSEKLERFTGKPTFHASGFSHPELLIYPSSSKYLPVAATWGLIPSWVKSQKEANTIWNKTLIARAESVFEKPSFQESAESRRCLIPIDGFFEHKHVNGKPFPYFVQRKDGDVMNLAGLQSEWKSPKTGEIVSTFSIITKPANEFMSIIHNNPKLEESRMPFILEDSLIDTWLDSPNRSEIEELLSEQSISELKAHPVQKLKGKNATGNNENVTNEVYYPELGITLFD